MKTIGNAWFLFCLVGYAVNTVRPDEIGRYSDFDWAAWLVIGLLPALFFWWKGGVFKKDK